MLNQAVYTDIQAKLETNMTEVQRVHGIWSLLNNDSRFKADPLNTLNCLYNFVSTNVHGSRSENDLMEYLCCSFLKFEPEIGPSCLTISCSLCNGSKTNPLGRLNYAGKIIHKNPTMSLCATKGMLIFYRFCIIKEILRDFTHPGNYYDIPALRSLKDPNKPIAYDLLYKNM